MQNKLRTSVIPGPFIADVVRGLPGVSAVVRPARLLPTLQSSVIKKLKGLRTGRILQEQFKNLNPDV